MLLSTGGTFEPMAARASVALAVVLLVGAAVAPEEEQELQRLAGYSELVSYLASHPGLRVPAACSDMVSKRARVEGAVPGRPREAERRCDAVLASLNQTGWRAVAFVPQRGAVQVGVVSYSLVHRRVGTAVLHLLVLLLLGPLLERQWGAGRLVAVYVGGAAVVAVLTTWVDGENPAPMAGAQVPLAVLAGATLKRYGQRKLHLATLAMRDDDFVEVPGWAPAALWLAAVGVVAWRGDASAGSWAAVGLGLITGLAADALVGEGGDAGSDAADDSPARQARVALQALASGVAGGAERTPPGPALGRGRRRSDVDAGPASAPAWSGGEARGPNGGDAADATGGLASVSPAAGVTLAADAGLNADATVARSGAGDGADPLAGLSAAVEDAEGAWGAGETPAGAPGEERADEAKAAGDGGAPSVPMFAGRSPLAVALPGEIDLSVALPQVLPDAASAAPRPGVDVPVTGVRGTGAPDGERPGATARSAGSPGAVVSDSGTFDPLADLDFAPATRPDAFVPKAPATFADGERGAPPPAGAGADVALGRDRRDTHDGRDSQDGRDEQDAHRDGDQGDHGDHGDHGDAVHALLDALSADVPVPAAAPQTTAARDAGVATAWRSPLAGAAPPAQPFATTGPPPSGVADPPTAAAAAATERDALASRSAAAPAPTVALRRPKAAGRSVSEGADHRANNGAPTPAGAPRGLPKGASGDRPALPQAEAPAPVDSAQPARVGTQTSPGAAPTRAAARERASAAHGPVTSAGPADDLPPTDLGPAPLQDGGRTKAYGADDVAHARRLIEARRARVQEPDAAPTVHLASSAPRDVAVSRAVAGGFAVQFADGSEGVLRRSAIRAVAVARVPTVGDVALVLLSLSDRRELWRVPMRKANLALLVGPGEPAEAAWRHFVTALAEDPSVVRLPRTPRWPGPPAPEFGALADVEALVLSEMRAG